jgi:hypothetical protein
VRRKVGLFEFAPSAIGDGTVGLLAGRVTARPVPGGRYDAVNVRVRLQGGRIFERRTTTMKGEPGNPLTDSELNDKVRACLSYGGFSVQTAEDLAGWIDDLESVRDPVPQLESIFRGGNPL